MNSASQFSPALKTDIQLGSGGSSKVYGCYIGGKLYAVKAVRNDRGFSKEFIHNVLWREFEVMQQFADHPNFLKALTVNEEGVLDINGKLEKRGYVLLELAQKGSLRTFIKKSGPFDETI